MGQCSPNKASQLSFPGLISQSLLGSSSREQLGDGDDFVVRDISAPSESSQLNGRVSGRRRPLPNKALELTSSGSFQPRS